MIGLIFTILSVLGTIALAFIMLFNNRKSVIHITLFIFSLAFAGAIGSNYLTSYFTKAHQVLLWIKITMLFASVMTPPFYLFISNFPERKLVISPKKVGFTVALTVGSMLLAISPWLFTKVEISGDNVIASQGPAFFYFIVVFMYYLVRSIILLIRKIRSTTGVQKAQLLYILSGLAISFGFILFFNVVMTLIFKNSRLILLTNAAPLIFIGTVGYAIIKHRLMDIRLVVKRAGVYLANIIIIILIALLLYRLESAAFKQAIPPGSWGPIVLLFSLVIYNPLKRLLERIANKYFFTGLYNYQATLEGLGRKLTFTINLSEIVDSIIKTIKGAMRLDRAGVLLYDSTSSNYKIYRTEGFTESNGISLVRNNFLTSYLIQSRKPVLYQELESLQTNGNGDKGEIAKLKTNMSRIEAHICLPLLVRDKLIGIIVLGQKISKDAYTKEDLRLLEAVANQASIAVENARQYDRIQQFNRTLEQKVDEQTSEIKEQNTHLQELIKMKSEFLQIASHQLRTPLSAIRGLLSMQADGDFDKLSKKEHKEQQKKMLESANRLSNIVNDLLDAMELEGGYLNFDFAPVALDDIITAIMEELRPNYDKKSLYLKLVKPKDPLPKIEAESRYLREALENFIDNAEKYTNKGGTTVTLSRKNNHVVVAISDTGIGIPKTDMPRLFHKFSRGDKSSYQHTDGSGLGLFIAKNIIDEHRGTIAISSPGEGKGTTITVTLPLTQPSLPKQALKA